MCTNLSTSSWLQQSQDLTKETWVISFSMSMVVKVEEILCGGARNINKTRRSQGVGQTCLLAHPKACVGPEYQAEYQPPLFEAKFSLFIHSFS
jgi:hypothetical protein